MRSKSEELHDTLAHAIVLAAELQHADDPHRRSPLDVLDSMIPDGISLYASKGKATGSRFGDWHSYLVLPKGMSPGGHWMHNSHTDQFWQTYTAHTEKECLLKGLHRLLEVLDAATGS